jgi:hypothetical protein
MSGRSENDVPSADEAGEIVEKSENSPHYPAVVPDLPGAGQI